MSDLLPPPNPSAATASLPLKRVHVCADQRHIDSARRLFRADADAPQLETAIVYGLARVLVDEFADDADFQDVLGAMARYHGAVATLQFRAWVLREDIQVLRFRLAAAGAGRPPKHPSDVVRDTAHD